MYLEVKFGVSPFYKVEKRKAYDLLTMFGDVGGLADFLKIIASSAFGFASQQLLRADQATQLFFLASGKDHASQKKTRGYNRVELDGDARCRLLCHSCFKCFFPRKSRTAKLATFV